MALSKIQEPTSTSASGFSGTSEAYIIWTRRTETARHNSPTALLWVQTPKPERAKLIEKTLWEWYAETHPPPAPAKPLHQEELSKRWWVESPPELQKHDAGNLCEVCRHVDFQYLINSPPEQILEFKLSSLKWVVDLCEECAFCRLVILTVKRAVGGRDLPTQVDEKQVMCSMRVLPIDTDMSGRREICLLLIPPPKGIDRYSNLIFYKFSPRDDQMMDDSHRGQLIEWPCIDFELVSK